MRIVFKADRLLCGISVPEFFVTDRGLVQILSPSTVGITLCQSDGEFLVPQVRLILPVESLMEMNPAMARRCMGKVKLA